MNFILSVAKVMTGLTSGFRFPGQLNSDLRKLTTNTIPFPRLRFLIPGLAPLVPESSIKYLSHSTPELVRNMFDQRNMMVDCQAFDDRYLTVSALLRGNISMNAVESVLAVYRRNHCHKFTEWIPDNINVSVCNVPTKGLTTSGVFVGNTTAFRRVIRRILTRYDQMLRRKAFFHWYTAEGMDEIEFINARTDVLDLISEYETSLGTKSEYMQNNDY